MVKGGKDVMLCRGKPFQHCGFQHHRRGGACRYMRLSIDDYGSITFIKYILNRDKVGGADFK